jgi:hypothetical protein
MALIRDRILFEVTFENLAVPLSAYAHLIVEKECAEQIFCRRPWSKPEDKKLQKSNFTVRVIRPKKDSNEPR